MQIENCQTPSQKTTHSIRTETTISDQNHKTFQYSDIQLDVHYKICQTFFNQIGKHFITRQCNVIQQSEQLIRNIQEKLTEKQLSLMDKERKETVQKQNSERSLILESQCSVPKRGIKRVLSRTKLTPNTKNWFTLLQNSLIDIQQNCSRNTFLFFNNILEQNKKLADKLSDIQKRQAHLRKKKQYYQLLEKEILISKAKIREVQNKLSNMTDEIARKDSLLEKSQMQYMAIYQKLQVQQSTPRLKSSRSQTNLYLRQKQQLLKNKQQQLRQLDSQILQKLSTPFDKNKCQKCCTLLKTWKTQMLKYKNYLQEQFEDMEKIYAYQKHQLANNGKKYV